jgi:mannosyltransferase OCH1-like enzyme
MSHFSSRHIGHQIPEDKDFEILTQPPSSIEGFIAQNFWASMEFGRPKTEPDFKRDPVIEKAELNFNRFCEEPKQPQYLAPPQKNNIPPIFHFVWLGSEVPLLHKQIIETWGKFHPGWEIRFWDKYAIDRFPWSSRRSKLVYESAIYFAEQSDVIRLEILNRFGGVYIDTDAICLKSINDLISSPSITFFIGQEKNYLVNDKALGVNGALMGATKSHPIIQFCLENMIALVEAPWESILTRTGPLLITKACSHFINEGHEKEILVLPCSYFYPLPFYNENVPKKITAEEIKNQYIAKESIAVHLWAKSLSSG